MSFLGIGGGRRQISRQNPIPVTEVAPESTANADDSSATFGNVVTSPTVGAWVELMPLNGVRKGAIVQNKDSSASLFIVKAATAPPSGTAAGEIEIPARPNMYKFDYIPRGRYFVRSSVASSNLSLVTW